MQKIPPLFSLLYKIASIFDQLDFALVRWAKRKYKRLGNSASRATAWLKRVVALCAMSFSDRSGGVSRRRVIFNFSEIIPENERDTLLCDKIAREL